MIDDIIDGIISKKMLEYRKIIEQSNSLLDIYNNASYLITLYDKLDGNNISFYCNQLKLEKMLILANLDYYILYHKKMNELNILYDDNFGFKIDTREIFLRSPITTSNQTENRILNDAEIKLLYGESKSSGIMFFDEGKIEDDVKEILLRTFIRYASCDTRYIHEDLISRFEEVISLYKVLMLEDKSVTNSKQEEKSLIKTLGSKPIKDRK